MLTNEIILAYALIVVGVVIWGALIPGGRMVKESTLGHIATFGGAFLLGSCFINLVPHMYLQGFETPRWGFKVGGAAMIGFLIQLTLEQLTKGIEHGHLHHDEAGDAKIPMLGLMTGLCLHALLEGMPLMDADMDIHQGLLWGIVLHNIPISLVLVSLCMANGYGLWRSLLMLLTFAVMTPIGSLLGLGLVAPNKTMSCLMMGVVVGILLHVSISILFDKDHNKFSWIKLLLIVLAFVAAYFTPGCPEIYV